MIENNPTNVSAGFEMLLEETEAEIEFFAAIGRKALDDRDLDRVEEAVAHARSITAFRDELAAMQAKWDELAEQFTVAEEEEEAIDGGRRNLGRLQRGLRTPEHAFRMPILQALVELGGNGSVSDVLDHVETVMKPKLKDVDFEPLASDPNNLRWRNTAQWSRNIMVNEGLLKSDSPRGVWEITDKGRESIAD